LNNHNTHWTLTFDNYSQKERGGDRLGSLFPPGWCPSSIGGKNLTYNCKKFVSVIRSNYIQGSTISDLSENGNSAIDAKMSALALLTNLLISIASNQVANLNECEKLKTKAQKQTGK